MRARQRVGVHPQSVNGSSVSEYPAAHSACGAQFSCAYWVGSHRSQPTEAAVLAQPELPLIFQFSHSEISSSDVGDTHTLYVWRAGAFYSYISMLHARQEHTTPTTHMTLEYTKIIKAGKKGAPTNSKEPVSSESMLRVDARRTAESPCIVARLVQWQAQSAYHNMYLQEAH